MTIQNAIKLLLKEMIPNPWVSTKATPTLIGLALLLIRRTKTQLSKYRGQNYMMCEAVRETGPMWR